MIFYSNSSRASKFKSTYFCNIFCLTLFLNRLNIDSNLIYDIIFYSWSQTSLDAIFWRTISFFPSFFGYIWNIIYDIHLVVSFYSATGQNVLHVILISLSWFDTKMLMMSEPKKRRSESARFRHKLQFVMMAALLTYLLFFLFLTYFPTGHKYKDRISGLNLSYSLFCSFSFDFNRI